MLDFNEYLRQQRQLLLAGDDVSASESNRMMSTYNSNPRYSVSGGIVDSGFNKINANLFASTNNTPISNVNPPSDMSTPQQNMNPFINRNMSPQQIINMAYRLGGGTYEGAVKAAGQYGVDLNTIVANRDKARRVPTSPKAQQAKATISSIVVKSPLPSIGNVYTVPDALKYRG